MTYHRYPRVALCRPKFLTLLLCLFVGVLSARSETGWKEYKNERFGFLLRYPGTLLPERDPENGSGREYRTPDGEFRVVALGHFLRLDEGDSLQRRWETELEALGGTITYKKKAATWYVVSGLTKDNTEYYYKLYVREGNYAGFRITYPHAKNKKYDPWVVGIEKNFVPFLDGDFDRIQK